MVRLVALYFPQLHPIPENDQWWGKGFTDWVNVKKAQPLFPEHYQPRVPKNSNYYDQSQEETIRQQVKLAQEYGIYGFCHYHYWFDGKQLLETPTNIFLKNKDLDIKFCLAWANETWSRRWDGQDHDILQLQTHPPEVERWALHFDYLIQAWTDERAIKIDGKPVFLIYRPQKIYEIGKMFDYWQTKAKEYGLKGIFFIAINQYQLPEKNILRHFDGVMLFQPFFTAFNLKNKNLSIFKRAFLKLYKYLPLKFKDLLILLQLKTSDKPISTTFYDYDEIWKNIIASKITSKLPVFEGAFVDWDNTARYGNRATIFEGATPEKFEYWLKNLVSKVSKKNDNEQLIFINAWNEWAESAYLEPDERYGLKYLESLKKSLENSEN
ncbi:glycoside hydrolase family 99-like domain-containing protein [Synechocystis salina]|uniref:Glycoside hydrolase family 99-like domain-containing protein n=1 Tax=Synechocystis salina LEGE 00031 TaxID=1828736 RepID=A0ABR9VWD9_9SYNC|nr:glycoside hydrolase family 99-like domain-containing protein [Synechocystis salina]MBE9242842.1 glycoside hydrolase family 99-like domain-containing protein [Synechocystis salina LEGE 00041]MBE9255676.1 glycoside hydrolase family 99-like domain-containing protein [Synechocystis salina LEGE 00031]